MILILELFSTELTPMQKYKQQLTGEIEDIVKRFPEEEIAKRESLYKEEEIERQKLVDRMWAKLNISDTIDIVNTDQLPEEIKKHHNFDLKKLRSLKLIDEEGKIIEIIRPLPPFQIIINADYFLGPKKSTHSYVFQSDKDPFKDKKYQVKIIGKIEQLDSIDLPNIIEGKENFIKDEKFTKKY